VIETFAVDRPLSITIGGASYKVHTSASAEDLERLAALVDARLRELLPKGRSVKPEMFLLVALSFANDAEEERTKRKRTERETRDLLRRVMARIDLALEEEEGPDDAEASPSSPT
jgi:cell division protein ZapA (FtsZ GTPase activity inhibitor)